MKTTSSFLIFMLLAGATALVQGPWSDVSKTPDERAHALVSEMTLDEKLAMLHGPPTGPCCQCTTNATCAYIGNVVPNARLGIPPINMNDGPQGFRDNNSPGSTTGDTSLTDESDGTGGGSLAHSRKHRAHIYWLRCGD